jgi:hypothetical protein
MGMPLVRSRRDELLAAQHPRVNVTEYNLVEGQLLLDKRISTIFVE